MNPITHRPSKSGCPHCLSNLVEVAGTGFVFCPAHVNWGGCDYEWRKHQRSNKSKGLYSPLTAAQLKLARYNRDIYNYHTQVNNAFKAIEESQGTKVALEQLQIVLNRP